MDDLPQEIISLIVEALYTLEEESMPDEKWGDKPPLAQYAGISKRWQVELERHLFASFLFWDDELDYFFALFNGSDEQIRAGRRRVLYNLQLYINRLPFDEELKDVPETEHEQFSNSLLLTITIKRLLEFMNTLSHDSVAHTDVSLRIVFTGDTFDLPKPYARKRRFNSSRLRLITDDELAGQMISEALHIPSTGLSLPYVPTIRNLDMSEAQPSYWHSTIAEVASYLPNLSGFHSCEDGSEESNADRWEQRIILAKSLRILPITLTKVWITISTMKTSDLEDFSPYPTPACDSKSAKDHLSICIRQFSTSLPNLVSLMVSGEFHFSNALFVEDEDNDKGDYPQASPGPLWPNLKDFSIAYSRADAFGNWLFKRGAPPHPTLSAEEEAAAVDAALNFIAPAEDDLEGWLNMPLLPWEDMPHPFRYVPHPNKMRKMYEAAARAALGMPELEYMSLTAAFNNTLPHKFEFIAPRHRFYKTGDEAVLKWTASLIYSPSEDLLAIWRRKVEHLKVEFEVDERGLQRHLSLYKASLD